MLAATTTAAFGRGSKVNDWGDDVDDDTPNAYATGVPVAITTKTRTVFLPDSGEARVIVNYVGRVDPRFGVKPGDSLKDERTGQRFLIDDVAYNGSFIGTQACVLALRTV